MNTNYYKIALNVSGKLIIKIVEATQAMAIADQMVQEAGGPEHSGVPTITQCDKDGNDLEKVIIQTNPVEPQVVVAETKQDVENITNQNNYSTWNDTKVDEKAKERIENLHQLIEQNGGPKIDTKQQFFATGTRMAREGYALQENRKAEHLAKQNLEDAIQGLYNVVTKEQRTDIHISAKEIANSLKLEDDKLFVKNYVLSEHALRGLMLRLDSPATKYVLGLQSRVLENINNPWSTKDLERLVDTIKYECLRFGDVEFKLRTRLYPDENSIYGDVYAALSPDFGVADAPMLLEQIQGAMPKDAKGSFKYDADTTAWNLKASIWTPTPVSEQAVGEPFEGSISLSSRDNGTGRFRGGGGIELLRCLNASVYSAGDVLSRVHRGSKVLFDIRNMISKAQKAVDTLCLAWGKARKETVPVPEGLTLEQAIPGIWRNLFNSRESELVGILPGRKENHIQALTQEYWGQRRDKDNFTKSDLAQAWTHYIQKQPYEIREEAERAAANFIVNPYKFRCDLKEKD